MASSRYSLRISTILLLISIIAIGGYLLVNPTSSASSAHSAEASIEGHVSIKGSTGGPAPKTYIKIFKKGTTTVLKWAETQGSSGFYRISGIEPGIYDLRAKPEIPYREAKIEGKKIDEGTNPVDIVVEHSVSSRLDGTTRSETGEFLAKTEVCVFDTECDECNLGCTTSGEDGAYALQVAPARYLVRIRVKNATGVETVSFATKEVNVLPNEPLTFNLKASWRGSELIVTGVIPVQITPDDATFQISPKMRIHAAVTTAPRSISGKVLFDGNPIPGVSITVTGGGGRPQTATTNTDGIYIFLNLEPGAYTVTGTPPTNFASFLPTKVQVSSTIPASVFVELRPAGSGELAQVTVNDETNSLPYIARNVPNLLSLQPGVTRQGFVYGGRSDQSNITLDGVDVNTPDPSIPSNLNMSVAALQEFAVVSQRYSAENTSSSGRIQIIRSGTNELHGNLFGYGTTKGFVRELKNFPFTGAAFNDYSDLDLGGEIGGPIVKDKLFYFGAFNPQRRTNHYLTQSVHRPVSNRVTVPFYAGKINWNVNLNHQITFSTFGDFTKTKGFLANTVLKNVNGFGDDPTAFEGRQEAGGHNYTFRLNSTFTNTFTGEFSGRLSFQRANTIPLAFDQSRITDNFAVLKDDRVLVPIQSGVNFGSGTGLIDYVDGRGGTLQRNFVRGPGFGLFSNQNRNCYAINARMLTIVKGRHTIKWGSEWSQNRYDVDMRSTGPSLTYGFTPGAVNADGTPLRNTNGSSNVINGSRITNNWLVCTVRGAVINCPDAAGVARVQAIPGAQLAALGLTVNPLPNSITTEEAFNTPFLIRNTTRVRDFQLVGETHTNLESFYATDDFRVTSYLQLNFGLRWDYQQAYANNRATLKLNNFFDNAAPRLGFSWDFTRRGKGKLYGNYAKFVEVPLSWELSVRAAAGRIHSDKHFNVDRLNAPPGSLIVPGVSTGTTNLGAGGGPPDRGLKPQSTREFSLGVEYELGRDFIVGSRAIYQTMINVIEDASFDDGDTYFIFNPGRLGPGTTEQAACAGDPITGRAPRCFGRAQRFYRALEFTAAKRLSHHYLLNASYVFSSLIGNYSGSLPIDYWQSDPNFISLFDSRSLLENTYGRLPYDRPHSFKFSGSYETPFMLTVGGTFSAQSGVPFNALIPHPIYGNNEGFLTPRGTAIIPAVTPVEPGFPNIVDSIGSRRTPAIINLDLNVNQRFELGESKDLFLYAAWFNVFNSQRATSLDQTFQINSGVAGVPNVANPFFGSALLSQTPSSFRFGIKFTF
jgi:TonB dependent receptor/Carboxypeptidase regulatory-like domain